MSEKKGAITASSIARMAGNIASGMVANPQFNDVIDLRVVATNSVKLAYYIQSEIEKVEEWSEARPQYISAAPSMLIALRAIRKSCPTDPDVTREFNAAWGLLEAAIAKAEGV